MTHEEVIIACINKELEPYGFTYEDIKKGGQYEFIKVGFIEEKRYFFGLFKRTEYNRTKKIWYQYFTFNSKENYNSWKEFCINLFRKELKYSKVKAEREFAWFDLQWGLKKNYELDK